MRADILAGFVLYGFTGAILRKDARISSHWRLVRRVLRGSWLGAWNSSLILMDSFCQTPDICGLPSAGTDIETSARAEGFLQSRRNLIRVSIAFAASLALHFIVIAFLAVFIPSSGTSSRQSAGLSGAPFIVSIVNQEKRSQPDTSPSRQPAPGQATRDAYSAVQDMSRGGIASARNAGLPGVYYSTSELDAIPKIKRDVDLYPPELHNFRHGGGKVVLRLWIDETGRVERVEPTSSDLTGIFAEVAARTFMQARFLPGMKNGSAVKSGVEAVLFYPSRDS